MVARSSAPSASATAARVTVRAVLQFVVVNVSALCGPEVAASASTVTAPASALVIVTVTSPPGADVSRTA